MMKRNGQISLEYAWVLGLVLLVTVPLFAYAQHQYAGVVSQQKVDETVNALIDVADNVYVAGPGAAQTVWVNLPGGITTAEVGGRHISIKFNLYGQETEVHGLSKADLVGTMPQNRGTYRMRLESINSTTVSIGTS